MLPERSRLGSPCGRGRNAPAWDVRAVSLYSPRFLRSFIFSLRDSLVESLLLTNRVSRRSIDAAPFPERGTRGGDVLFLLLRTPLRCDFCKRPTRTPHSLLPCCAVRSVTVRCVVCARARAVRMESRWGTLHGKAPDAPMEGARKKASERCRGGARRHESECEKQSNEDETKKTEDADSD